jgi:predicted enzyme related to lactoylglutathione lyase
MAETAVSAPGAPTWVDFASPDIKKSAEFYSGLFGWQAIDLGPDAGNYHMFTLNGKQVAAGSQAQEWQPAFWSVYFATEDADATAKAVEAAGGKIAMEPFDVMEQGRMAVFEDPSGAFFSVWQPRQMKGAELMHEAGTFDWAELNTGDLATAESFYPKVFGWSVKKSPMGEGAPEYTEWQVNGESVGGGMDTTAFKMPADIPPFWLVYFAVPDVDAAAKKVAELGGHVEKEPSDFPGGRFAIVADPHHIAFALLKLQQ